MKWTLPFIYVLIATPSHGVIQSLVSTSSGSEQAYVCGDELHTFICTVSGTQLVWSINTSSPLRMEFFGGRDEIGHSITQSTQAIGVLLRNDQSVHQLQSALFVNYSQEYFDRTSKYGITCASDTKSDSLLSTFSAIPQNPKFTQVFRLNYNETLAHYHLQWKAPANSNSTIIDQYILSVGSRNISVHSTQTDIVVPVNLLEENNVKISAVDRCNQRGSHDYVQINQSEVPRVNDCELSTMSSSSESISIILYTVPAVSGVVVLMTCVICSLMIVISFRKGQRRSRGPSTSDSKFALSKTEQEPEPENS